MKIESEKKIELSPTVVQCAADLLRPHVDAPLRQAEVPPRLHDVDLPRGGPQPVLQVHREHPDGRPDPVAARVLRADLREADEASDLI